METQLWAIGLALAAAVFCGLGPIYLKKGAEKFNLSFKKQLENKPLLKGIGLYLLATVFFIPALKGGEVSVLYPVASTSYIWVGLFSMKFLSEKMSILKWVGFGVIILGIVIISAGIPASVSNLV